MAGNQEEHVKTQDREVKKAYDAWMSAPSDKKSQALSKLNEERGKLNSKYSAYTSAMTGQPKIKTLSEIIGHSPY